MSFLVLSVFSPVLPCSCDAFEEINLAMEVDPWFSLIPVKVVVAFGWKHGKARFPVPRVVRERVSDGAGVGERVGEEYWEALRVLQAEAARWDKILRNMVLGWRCGEDTV